MFNVTPHFRGTGDLICPPPTLARLDGNLLYANAFHKRAHPSPPLPGLGLEITKELWEVIITVISSQKRRPPTGKGRRPALGKSFPRGERDPHPARAACRPAPVADLFSVCGLSRDRAPGRPKKGVRYRFSLTSSLCLHVKGQREKGDGK